MSDLLNRIAIAQRNAGEAAVMAHLAEQGLAPEAEASMEGLEATKRWFTVAVPEPTATNAAKQIGCHFEEVAEMAEHTGDAELAMELQQVAENYKKRCIAFVVEDPAQRKALLDDLCDQIVTAVGVGHMLGFDVLGALAEVNRSNFSKFKDGKPLFNEHGKIAKNPETYFQADLTPFIGK